MDDTGAGGEPAANSLNESPSEKEGKFYTVGGVVSCLLPQ